HRLLEAGAEIGHVLVAERRARRRRVPERRLKPGEREMRFASAEHRAGQGNGGAPAGGASLDFRAARIAKAEQLGRLVERFAQRIVERGAEPLVTADLLDDKSLRMAAGH